MRLRRTPPNPTGEMSLLEHLLELRNRLVKSSLAFLVATAAAAAWLYEPAKRVLLQPYCQLPATYRGLPGEGQGDCSLLALAPLDNFGIRLRLALALGLVLAMPVIAFQVWRFITPGLKPNEKRYAIPFALASTVLFAAGVGVAFFTLPKALGFLVSLGGEGIRSAYTADRYLRFVLFMGLSFGVTFEFPLVLVFLSMVGVLSSQAMVRAWRPAVAVIIVVAAVVTPSQDPISLFAMAAPMWLFYFAAAALARFVIEPARARRRAQVLEQGS